MTVSSDVLRGLMTFVNLDSFSSKEIQVRMAQVRQNKTVLIEDRENVFENCEAMRGC